MKHFLTCALFGGLAAALLAPTVAAGNTIDKGRLGKYERQGRFVRPIMTPVPRLNTGVQADCFNEEGRAIIDKGALGKYERKGRFMKPVLTAAPRSSSPNPTASRFSKGCIVIDKSPLKRYERKGRFMRPIVANIQIYRSIRDMNVGRGRVIHVHRIHAPGHKSTRRIRPF